MKIVLLGANGRTGRLVIRQALAAGHTVTGLVRSADSMTDVRHDRLQIRVGNVSDPAFLKQVLPGHDAVISTVGPRSPMKSACAIYYESAAALAEAMQATALKRVLVTSTALLFPPSGAINHVLQLVARNNQKAAALMEDLIHNAGLDYTFARTGFLTNGDHPGFRTAAGVAPEGGGSISRLALANFLVTELDSSVHVRQVVGLCDDKAA